MSEDSAQLLHQANNDWMVLRDFQLPSQAGMEREAMRLVGEVISPIKITENQLFRLLTAVAEATMNAIEHGNKFNQEIPVRIQVLTRLDALSIRITDQGGGQILPEKELPDLEAKITGHQSPRGWGLFLIKNMVDQVDVISDGSHRTVTLILKLEGGQDASQATGG